MFFNIYLVKTIEKYYIKFIFIFFIFTLRINQMDSGNEEKFRNVKEECMEKDDTPAEEVRHEEEQQHEEEDVRHFFV